MHEKQLFVWKSLKWWDWFCEHRRCPTEKTLIRYINKHDGFLVFHGCRPTDIDVYYRKGLQPSNLDHLNQIARSIFLSGEFPEISEIAFCSAVESVSKRAMSRHDNGKIFVGIDQPDRVPSCGHYLIYGSEHICAIAASLTRGRDRDYRQVLKRFGIPTVFRIKLPMQDVNLWNVESLADYLRKVIWDSREQRTPPSFSWTFTLYNPISPERILGHYHPAEIPDPFLNNILYRYNEKENSSIAPASA